MSFQLQKQFSSSYLALITLFSKTLTPECTGETINTDILVYIAIG